MMRTVIAGFQRCGLAEAKVVFAWCATVVGLTLLIACSSRTNYVTLRGATMGTYYAIQFLPSQDCKMEQVEVDSLLATVNASMSTYQTDSEISRFNHSRSVTWQAVSPRLLIVVRAAFDVWKQAGGAFDVTVGPIVNLWGFGPAGETSTPTLQQQRNAQVRVGMDKLEFRAGEIKKNQPDVYVDLSALAKGFAVDVIAASFHEQCSNYLVDIGGEVRAHGVNARGIAWRIGVEVPDPASYGAVQRVLELDAVSVATSGDYRNYRVIDGVRVDHVIDPRSGVPAENMIASATVIHPLAMRADAYATTMMVLGEQAALAFADQHAIPVLLIVHQAGTGFREVYNEAMKPYLIDL
jgi:thiamine biosynthesis lipoprotein